MILSDKQMHVSRTALANLEAALDTIRSQSDSPEWVRQIEIDALESQIEDIRADMARYEDLRAGQVEFPESCSLEELPTRLVEIRIASHLTQTDLAGKLGLKPQQIQRYEASRYIGASLARLTNVANALLHGKEMPIKLDDLERTSDQRKESPMEVNGFDTGEGPTNMTYREAAIKVLKDRGPLHYRALMDAIRQSDLMCPTGATPEASLNAAITVDIRRNGKQSDFIRTGPGEFGLRGQHVPSVQATAGATDGSGDKDKSVGDDANLRVRVPHFPVYSELRHLLRVWPGRSRKQVTGLQTTINRLRGNREEAVDWTNPADWIPKRLEGNNRELAQAIWNQSNGVNPGHTYGHWLLAQRYNLVRDDCEGRLRLTKAGQGFHDQPGSEVESAVDEAEGLIKLLSIVADSGPVRARSLVGEWSDYLLRHSAILAESTIKDTMRRRLNNLLARGLVERKGSLYSATPDGLTYLEKTGDGASVGGGSENQVWALIRQQENTVRESLRELLHDMDPFDFEHLIKWLLEEMGYQNVEVTKRSKDGGVDVVGDIEVGISSVREAVQVKRYKKTPIGIGVLFALRGTLNKFNAVRGAIVTTSQFTRDAREAAIERGAAPITLVDGDKLVDLLIEYGIGVRKRMIELMEVDTEAIAAIRTDG